MNHKVKELVEQYAVQCAEEQEELLRTLGKIPAPSHQEDRRAEFCRDWFFAQGAEDVTIDKKKNVVCKYGCDTHEDLVVFMAHTDIVFPDLEPLAMREEGRKLFAPGIGDDTANLINLMMAFKYLLKNHVRPNCGLLIVANSCEEGLGNLEGCKEIFAEYGDRIKAFYSLDGYLSGCCNAAVGSHRYKVTVKTQGGHSWSDFGSANAIEILCGLVEKLYQIEVPEEANAKTTYNVGRMEGGTTVNSVAQEAYILYEFRSTSQNCLIEMDKKFKETVDAFKSRGGEISVELLGIRPGNGPVPKDELERFTAKNAEIIGNFFFGKLEYGAYSTDSNIPLSMGIIANTIGTVSGGKPHTREEWIDMDSLPAGLKIALSLMLEYTDQSEVRSAVCDNVLRK